MTLIIVSTSVNKTSRPHRYIFFTSLSLVKYQHVVVEEKKKKLGELTKAQGTLETFHVRF